MKLYTILISAVFSVIFLMSGCASKSIVAKNSGFFKDYEEFKDSNNFHGSIVQVSAKADISKYKNILLTPVKVIPAIAQAKQTGSQKKLYQDISDYLNEGYKKEIAKSNKYKLTETKSPNTLRLESAISTVEVHFDDKKWNQLSPVSMGVTVVSYNAYLDEDVRILGEKRLVDSMTGEVLLRSINIIKDKKIVIENDYLDFKDMNSSLDAWLEHIKKYFSE